MTECSPSTKCHMSGVRCQVSGVRCQVSGVTCNFFSLFFSSFFFTGQSGGANRWRVCYQRCLPRLVFFTFCNKKNGRPSHLDVYSCNKTVNTAGIYNLNSEINLCTFVEYVNIVCIYLSYLDFYFRYWPRGSEEGFLIK